MIPDTMRRGWGGRGGGYRVQTGRIPDRIDRGIPDTANSGEREITGMDAQAGQSVECRTETTRRLVRWMQETDSRLLHISAHRHVAKLSTVEKQS